MAIKGYLGTFAIAMTLATGATAQSAAVPAEFPPTDFTGNQFVDSDGCAFVRAGIAGTTNWVPRVSRTREQLCNFQPSFPDQVAAAPPAPIDPDLIIEITPPVEPVGTTRSAETAAPIATVASIPAARPAPVRAPAPVVQTPRIVAAPAIETPPPVTFAQACDGRFGIQPGFVSATTGRPIDCGPAPQAAPVIAAVPAVASPPRMTLAQICSEVAATGQRFVNAETGAPIVCAPTAPVAIAAAPAAPSAPLAPAPTRAPRAPAPAATSSTVCEGIPNMRGDGRYVVRCGPQSEKPYTEVSSASGTTQGRVSTSSAPLLGGTPEVPASNPPISTRAAAPNPPAGYERVWKDGRINPQRGLQATGVSARVSTRTAPQAAVAAPGHRYVQVGSFGNHANATQLMQRLNGMGLPVASGTSGGMKIVAAGPFNDAQSLARALSAVRGLGFGDAYTRN